MGFVVASLLVLATIVTQGLQVRPSGMEIAVATGVAAAYLPVRPRGHPMGLTIAIGALDEVIQLFLPSRVFDCVDILFNSLAALMATTASVLLGWARRVARILR